MSYISYAIQWLRSLIFNITMYLSLPIIGILYLPWALVSREGAATTCRHYCKLVCWLASWMIGLKTEIRGPIPSGGVMVAAKHQSFLDVLMIYGAVPRGKFIMKHILKYAPVVGWYGIRAGCIPVKRGRRGAAIKKMLEEAKSGQHIAGQMLIYPQGTRVKPWVKAPYKKGTGALYRQLEQPCIPASCNVGLFWPKRGVYRKQGTAIVEFHEPLPASLPLEEFMERIENVIETNSNRLMMEAQGNTPS